MRKAASKSRGAGSGFDPGLGLDRERLPVTITNAVCFCYLVVLYIQQTVADIPYIQILLNGLIVAGGALSLMLNMSRGNKTDWLFYVAFAMASWLVVYLVRPEWRYPVNSIISTCSFMMIGLNFAKSEHSTRAYNGLLYVVLGTLLLRIVIFGESFRDILNFSSYNFISILALVYMVVAVKVQEKNNVGISIIEVVLFALVTLLSYGRAGIITGAVFSVMALILIIARTKSAPHRVLLLLGGAAVLIFGVQQIWRSGLLSKFARLSFDSNGRLEIWGKYLNTCFKDLSGFVFGGNPSFMEDGNLHNSFFQMYATFGLPFLLLNIFVIIRMLIRDIKCRDYQSLIVSLTFFLRCATDRAMFRSCGEVAYFFIIFDYLCSEKKPGDRVPMSSELRAADEI